MLNSSMIDLNPFASDQDTGLGDPFLIRRLRVKVLYTLCVRTDVSKYILYPRQGLQETYRKSWTFPGSLVHLCISPSTTVCPNPWPSQKLFGFLVYVRGQSWFQVYQKKVNLQYSSQILKHLCDFPLPQCWFGYYSRLSAPKYAWLNIGEGESHIWLRMTVSGVNVRNLEKIQDKWLLFQRFVTSIVGWLSISFVF